MLGWKCPDSCPYCLVGWLDYQWEVKKLWARQLRQIIMGRCALALPLFICALRVSSLILRHDWIPVGATYPLAQSLRFLRSCSDTRSLQTLQREWCSIKNTDMYIFINMVLIIIDEMQLCFHPTLGIYCTLHAPKFELIFHQNRSPHLKLGRNGQESLKINESKCGRDETLDFIIKPINKDIGKANKTNKHANVGNNSRWC